MHNEISELILQGERYVATNKSLSREYQKNMIPNLPAP